MESLDNTGSYERSIDHLAKYRSNKIFKNTGPKNASVILSTIFKYSKNEILMFSGNIKGDVTNSKNYVESVEYYLFNTVGKLKLFLEHPLKEYKNFQVYNLIKEYSDKTSNNRVQIKPASKEFLTAVSNKFGDIYHFTVGDGRMFRIEINPDLYEAIVSFNNKETASKLREFFLDYFNIPINNDN